MEKLWDYLLGSKFTMYMDKSSKAVGALSFCPYVSEEMDNNAESEQYETIS